MLLDGPSRRRDSSLGPVPSTHRKVERTHCDHSKEEHQEPEIQRWQPGRWRFRFWAAASHIGPALLVSAPDLSAVAAVTRQGEGDTKETFDVLVVGAGSSGCAAAYRLTRGTELSVGIVEAGPDYGPAASGRWPSELLDVRESPRTHDWGFFAIGPAGDPVPEERARVLGGCSSHNQCAAIWPPPEDYDAWAQLGNPGWSYQDVAPQIDRIERASGPQSPFRGREGLLPTRPYREDELASWQRLFLESSLAAGFPRLEDLSAPRPPRGVGLFHANVQDSTRWNAAFAFLDPVRDLPNLTILSRVLADRLVVRDGRAVSLVCRTEDGVEEVLARRFILCGGVYGSPLVLMRSGIGPGDHLAEVGVEPLVDLAGVGGNLQDHPVVSLVAEPSAAGMEALKDDLAAGRFHESQVILRTSSSHARDFDLHLLPFQRLVGEGEWTFRILVAHLRPQSRGRVSLRSPDPFDPPLIDFRFLRNRGREDVAVLEDGLILARGLLRVDPMSKAVKGEAKPGEDLVSSEDLRSYIRASVTGYAHPVGTCKMGPPTDPTAVVDHQGRVRGMENVLVADASIFPTIPRANTNLGCILVGFRVAEALVGSGHPR